MFRFQSQPFIYWRCLRHRSLTVESCRCSSRSHGKKTCRVGVGHFEKVTFPKKNLGEEIRKSDNHEISPGEPAKQIEKTWNPIP